MAAVHLLPMSQAVAPHSAVCDSRAASPSPPQDATGEFLQKPQWLDRGNTPPANDVDNVPTRNPASQCDVMERDIQHWSHTLPSLSQCDAFEPHGGAQSPSALQGKTPSIHESPGFIPEYPQNLMVPAASEPGTPIKEESFDIEDPTLALVHPIPRPSSLYIASRNMALFADSQIGFEPTPLFSSPTTSHEYSSDHDIVPKSEWSIDDLETAPLFNEAPLGRPIDTFVGTSFTPMNETCSPDSSLSWSPVGYQTSCDIQHQGVSQNEVFCSSGPELFSIDGQYGHVSAGFDQTTATSDLNCLTLLSNDSHSYLQPSVPLSPCRPDYTNRDTVMVNKDHDPFRFAAETFAYHESLLRLNQLTHQRIAVETNHHLRQQFLGNRTFSCPEETRNAFLIECKRRGLSYKDIKRLGGFKEAESTLRGRYRTLTKSKDQRVRKPFWHDNDIRLLCEAVNVCSENGKYCRHPHSSCRRPSVTKEPPKVPWKKVAQYIWAHGGSYHFGNATCKKKWCEVHNVKA
ncbi:hypothetical protein P170DRAFT_508829 [Aspergillus steynii IBT 23096]|uniref:Myb-like domain-containing protein n=1 Tax=Aspergillus steynii IBT 23096 TaxID=1392250 RepID=A0A2I2GCS4_9EURO|nr:uncharacterized protein P170DRAFT_508829 [Aspergillus steynii IBT 23096]PLB50683.1 hypothetical protein P170DRAFT_508829 [Aspergillus steynii IBT 23096]